MKISLKLEDGSTQALDVATVTITLSNGETLEISAENSRRPAHLCEGITVWGGKMPTEQDSLEELKASTRARGIYPLAANTLHLFPLKK